ncbi:two-partner secretion domain-containing protein [Scytonema sp. PRP1]|uniref:two-partner secretion domain-containing protein n=1 Tax=Scytonema sp. PRP1 TaxID=3120513 RepID=UPI002FD26CBC
MKLCPFRFSTFTGSALFWLLASYPVTAQIVPDTTVNTIVTPSGKTFEITEGTQKGSNLFHSFQQFSIRAGETAKFNNASDIVNIISRVTGGSISNIDGLIQAMDKANLFLINPSGIVFGPNARLQIGGSFVASTADSLRFADGTEFSATNPQAPPLLTISVPLGLQFGSNPKGIVNQSQAVDSSGFTVGLQVPAGKTLALVGGDVSLEGGSLTADGRIELGSVGTGSVTLTVSPQGYYVLGYSGVQNFQDIDLSGGAFVNTISEGDGGIQVQGRNVNLSQAAEIFTNTPDSGAGTGGNLTVNAAESVNLSGGDTSLVTETQGTGSAGNLTITTRKLTVTDGASIRTPSVGSGKAGDLLVKATDSVELSGTTADGQQFSNLSGQVLEDATGNGGNLTVETGRLTIRDGARISASTFGAGQTGDIRVTATDIELVGTGKTPIEGGKFLPTSGIFSQAGRSDIENTGNAGNVIIQTQRLTAKDGGQISAATWKKGNGGNLTINADSIQLSGFSPTATLDRGSSGFFVSAEEPTTTGNVGNLNINTTLLTVENGAKISADNKGTGQGGTLTLDVRQLTIQNGGLVRSGSFGSGSGGILTVKNADSVSVIGKGSINSFPVVSTLSAASTASGPAGNLTVTTRNLNVKNGGEVSVSGTGEGRAGNLTITANDLRLDGGKITATTNAGEEAANITLRNLNLLLMQNGSQISAQAFNNANGGNINIDARNGSVVAVPGQNNDIIASAVRGRGGEINITASGIFGIEERNERPITNDIDASSQFGLAGSVNINRPDVEPNLNLPELPTVPVDPSQLVGTGCAAFANSEGSSFTITGRGGLPPSPYEPLSPDVVWSDTRLPNITAQRGQVTTPPPSDTHVAAIVPATGWVFNGKGQVTLVSNASRTPGLGSTAAKCPKQ